MMYDKFYSLLRFSLDIDGDFPYVLTEGEWEEMFLLSDRQALLGVVYQGLRRLKGDRMPPILTIIKWTRAAEEISGMNGLLIEKCAYYTKYFSDLGRRNVILKGQGNARMYPCRASRNPGDIDIWVEGGKKSVIALLRKQGIMDPDSTPSYHHAHLRKDDKGVEVEVHYRPSSGNSNPFTNRSLQKFLEGEVLRSTLCEDGYYVPTASFNLPMQLSHIQKHFLSEGIGLRQIVDYYYVLRSATEGELAAFAAQVGPMGFGSTLASVLWVLREVLHLEEKYMPIEADERLGRILMDRMEVGGNFGTFTGDKTLSLVPYIGLVLKRYAYYMKYFPGETIWKPARHVWAVLRSSRERFRKGRLVLGKQTPEDLVRETSVVEIQLEDKVQ